MQTVNQDQVTKDWKDRGFSCSLWKDPPGKVWEGYVHESDELLMVMEGEVELEIDGKKITPPVGKEAFIPAHAVHSVRNVGKTTSRWLYGYNYL